MKLYRQTTFHGLVRGRPKVYFVKDNRTWPLQGEGVTNQLSVMKWNLTKFSIILCKVLTLDNVKQRQKQPKKTFSLLKVEGF